MYCKPFKLLFILLCLLAQEAYSEQNIQGVRIWASPEGTRVIFDLSGEVHYKLFTLDNPPRVVIDFEETSLKAKLNHVNLKDSRILNVRHSSQGTRTLRVVLDMQAKVKPSSFLLTANQSYGPRLVLDLNLIKNSISARAKALPAVPDKSKLATRKFIVAIDPGHGGDDTGAIGKNHKLKEKDVVLHVAKKLQSLINKQQGMSAFLIREGDYYVDLRKRMELARVQGADLFISVHADSFEDPKVTGASVFVLSEKGASNEAARWLAERENRSDLIGGLRLEDKGSVLASVLLDLSQTASQSLSQELAHHLVTSLSKVTMLHHKTVQRAGFMVLKSPDIPSVLVELGFISNLKGEEQLLNPDYQQILANALLAGVKKYVAKRPKPTKHAHDLTIAKGTDGKRQHVANAQPVLLSSRETL